MRKMTGGLPRGSGMSVQYNRANRQFMGIVTDENGQEVVVGYFKTPSLARHYLLWGDWKSND